MTVKLKKYLCIILSCLLFFLVGCNNNDNNVSHQINENHYANNQQTNEFFYRYGVCNYKVLLPKNAVNYEKMASDLLLEFIEKSTHYKMEVVYDDNFSESDRYVSIGDTQLLRESGIDVTLDTLGENGFIIKSKDNNIFLSGARSSLREGTLYATEELLHYLIGWEVYSYDEIKYDEKYEIELINFDVKEIPDFQNRRNGYKNTTDNLDYLRYLRLNILSEEHCIVYGHSHFIILPPEQYYNDHPDWYYVGHKEENCKECERNDYCHIHSQLCLSNEEMINQFAENCVTYFLDNPTASSIHLGMQDYPTFCDCDNCKKMREQYHTNDAGINVIFTNRIARIVTKKIQELQPERKIYFQTFAYYSTINPPADYDEETNKWTPHCKEVIPDSNVFIQFAPLADENGIFDYQIYETLDAPENKKYLKYLEGWKSLTDNISTWYYCFNVNWYLINFKDWDTYVDNLKVFKQLGIQKIYEQATVNHYISQFVELRTYVSSKLYWNTDLNYDDLAREFIKNYYGDASSYIQEYWDVMTTYYEYLHTEKKLGGNISKSLSSPDYWSYSYVEHVRTIFENAFKALEVLKETDMESYEKYYDRVASEYVENMFMQMEYYISKYSKEHVLETLDLFSSVVAKRGMEYMSESLITINSYVDKWRALYA